ncbi:hypothetical protein [Streptococcus anginosus]|nr:hypothetical protein [Streptococcus anginosus]
MVVNEGHSKGGYTRKSNKVLIHTPGKQQPNKPNDPKNPNRDPLKPEKHNYNAAGKLVDGKEMLPEGINYYVSKWTNSSKQERQIWQRSDCLKALHTLKIIKMMQ